MKHFDDDKLILFKNLSNPELLETTKALVKKETKVTLLVLHALREIELRRAFAEKHYPDLLEFCMDYLGYKKGAAYRRILAMRALKDFPEVEKKVEEGAISLTTLSQAQSFFNQKKSEMKPLKTEEKREVLKTLENMSTRETEKFFLKVNPRPHPKESIKAIDVDTYDMHLPLPKRVKDKIDRLKELMSAEKASVDTIEALEDALDARIATFEKKIDAALKQVPAQELKSQKMTAKPRSDYIPIHTRRQVWRRDQSQCTFLDPLTKKRCCAKKYLEIDHIIAWALGGSNDLDNLRLLCRAHNQLAASRAFGRKKMEKYFDA